MKMKVLLIITLLGYATCGRLDSSYLPPHQSSFGSQSSSFNSGSGSFGPGSGSFASGSGSFGSGSGTIKHSVAASGSFGSQPAAAAYSGSFNAGGYSGTGQQIPILRLDEENSGDGSYRYNYETANGISAQEQGDARGDGTRAKGGFSYTAPDGQQIHIQYTADENGFQAQGPHIPTPPPVPEAIQRSIEQNLADEARGVVDDGQYKSSGAEGQYRSGDEGQYSSSGHFGASGNFGTSGNFRASENFGASGNYGGASQSHQQGGYKY